MGFLLQSLDRLLPDPRPAVAFEIGDGILLGARCSGRRSARAIAQRELPKTGAVDPGAAKEALREAVGEIVAELGPVPSPHASVLLPDSGTRMMVLEFDRLPLRPQELRRAVEDRLGSSLPFDPGDARIAYRVQRAGDRNSVLVTAASAGRVRACERAFEEAGLLPGYVGLAAAAALNLVATGPMALLLRVGERALTMVAVERSAVRLVRRIAVPGPPGEDSEATLGEILADLYPTLAYIEENLGTPVTRLLLSGFGGLLPRALQAMRAEIAFPVDPLDGRKDGGLPVGEGLEGYVRG